MKSLITLLIILGIARTHRLAYVRIVKCVEENQVKCLRWEESSALIYKRTWSSFCYSENTFVQTKEGPKSMGAIRINDEVLGLDPATGKQTYSKVVAWLHRDTQAIAKYDSVTTKQGAAFEASDYHNIAFANSDGKVDFKFAKDLREGDELIGLPSSAPVVDSVQPEGERRGLYSPFTEVGNYYVFNSAFRGEGDAKAEPMILAHVLSQVSNPNSDFPIALYIINLCQNLGLNQQPLDSQIYIHPLVSYFSFLFGSSWIPVEQEVKYYIEDEPQAPSQQLQSNKNNAHDQRSRSRSSGSRPSKTYHPFTSPTRSLTYHPSVTSRQLFLAAAASGLVLGAAATSYPSYSSHSNRQKEKENTITSLGLSISILQEIFLL